jgi:1-phosphofructokinase
MSSDQTNNHADSIVTVTLNPAIDQTLAVPGFAAGKVNRVTRAESHPAGKGVNVAVVLADLGAPATATGFLGDANAGGFEAVFRAKRIEDQFVRLPGETRVGVKVVDDDTGETTDINFPGLTPTEAALGELHRRVARLATPGRWFVLCGSVPAGVAADVYATLADAVRGGGGHVALDTSGEPLRAALARGPAVAKPNAAELAELAGQPLDTPADVVAAARDLLLSRGVRLAVVSMGGDGAVFVEAGRALLARPPRVRVRSTVGAGDAMVAGLVFGRHRGMPLEECARLSTALGAHAVTRVGAGLESPAAHEAYYPEIKIERLE